MNKETLRAIKFTLFSISAGVIQIGTFTLLNELTGLHGQRNGKSDKGVLFRSRFAIAE